MRSKVGLLVGRNISRNISRKSVLIQLYFGIILFLDLCSKGATSN